MNIQVFVDAILSSHLSYEDYFTSAVFYYLSGRFPELAIEQCALAVDIARERKEEKCTMEKLVNLLSKITERTVKCVFSYDLKVGGYIDYSYYDSCDNVVSGTYIINNPVSLAILTN